jgi:hypothetical protein
MADGLRLPAKHCQGKGRAMYKRCKIGCGLQWNTCPRPGLKPTCLSGGPDRTSVAAAAWLWAGQSEMLNYEPDNSCAAWKGMLCHGVGRKNQVEEAPSACPRVMIMCQPAIHGTLERLCLGQRARSWVTETERHRSGGRQATNHSMAYRGLTKPSQLATSGSKQDGHGAEDSTLPV